MIIYKPVSKKSKAVHDWLPSFERFFNTPVSLIVWLTIRVRPKLGVFDARVVIKW